MASTIATTSTSIGSSNVENTTTGSTNNSNNSISIGGRQYKVYDVDVDNNTIDKENDNHIHHNTLSRSIYNSFERLWIRNDTNYINNNSTNEDDNTSPRVNDYDDSNNVTHKTTLCDLFISMIKSTSSEGNNNNTSTTSNGSTIWCNPLEKITWIRTGIVLFVLFWIILCISYYTIQYKRTQYFTKLNIEQKYQQLVKQNQYILQSKYRLQILRPILLQYTNEYDLLIPTSPQFKALHWILYKDTTIQLNIINTTTSTTIPTASATSTSKTSTTRGNRHVLDTKTLFVFNSTNNNNNNSSSLFVSHNNTSSTSSSSNNTDTTLSKSTEESTSTIVSTTSSSSTTSTGIVLLDEINMIRLQQRYAILVLFFATGGKAWQRSIDNDNNNNTSSSSRSNDVITDSTSTITTNAVKIKGYDELYNINECLFEGIVCTNYIVNDATTTTNSTSTTGSSITEINLNGFGATGYIPSEIHLLTSLRSINFGHNHLRGTIPSIIFTKLTNLESIQLEHNAISASIPSNIGNLYQLKNLSINENQITGTIPKEIQLLNSLTVFNIAGNTNISGYNALNYILNNKTQLHTFIMDRTSITGTIPKNLSNYIPFVQTFSIASTVLTGPLPTNDINNLRQLKILNIENDDIYGPIPDLQLLTNLEHVTLQGYNLAGTISSSGIENIKKLSTIMIRGTLVSGTIPSGFAALQQLEKININLNFNLKGSIPSEFGNLTSKLRVIEIYANDNNGTWPSGLCLRQGLKVIRPCSVETTVCNDNCG